MPSPALGAIIFILLWVLLLRSRWSFFPLGRPGSSLLCAALYVCLGQLSPEKALAAINVPTLGLLLGCMLLCAHAEKAGLLALLARTLGGGTGRGPLALLGRTSALSGFASALVTNDTACLLLPSIVIRACKASKAPPVPLLIVLATAANIGSACSPVGNPQNMLIALASGLPFSAFLGAELIPSVLGLIINAAVVSWAFKSEGLESQGGALSGQAGAAAGSREGDTQNLVATSVDRASVDGAVVISASEGVVGRPASPTLSIPPSPPQSSQPPALASAAPAPAVAAESPSVGGESEGREEGTPPPTPLRARLIRAVLILVLPALMMSHLTFGLTWTVLGAAALCFALDGVPPEPLLERVDGGLLLFFSGLFVCVEGFNATGIPDATWALVEPSVGLEGGGATASGVALFVVLVAVGSNVVSNVPLVLLLAPKLSGATSPGAWWLVLAWGSTVAGNLTLLGSVANLIVAEGGAKEGVEVTFGAYNRVGVVSTVLLLVLGTPMVWGLAKALGW